MHEILNSPTPRRGFLGRIAAFAAGMTLVAPSGLAAEAPTFASSADPALDAWFGRIKGKHRMVFDASAPNNGMAAVWPRVYMNTMAATYPGETTAVIIFRHEGLPLVLGDAVWSKYHLGEMFKVNDGAVAATRNPYATITNIPLPGLGVAELLKSGVLVGACDVAMSVYSGGAAKKMGMDPAAVKAEWIAGLLPGVQLVPSGVLGVAHAQELGCAYCFAG